MPELNEKATVSIVVPFHNEEGNVTELYARLHAVMESTNWGYQFVFVDDGSTDRTFKLLSELAVIDAHVTVVRLRRNFGQTAALAAGFTHSNREYVIAMDGDLQHIPGEARRGLRHCERLAQAPHRQLVAAEDSFPLRKLADGKAERCGHS